jgi:uncharacterized protein
MSRHGTTYAFDKSLRHVDADGRLHVEKSRISKACVNPYYGREIPEYEELGLEPNKVYLMFRDPAELEAGAATFANLPILKDHVPVTADKPRQDLVVGTIGSKVEFEAPYLLADLCVWDADAIQGIESKKVRELSCAYRYVPVMERGHYQGEFYDGRMTKIQGNHLALVENGRAGSDVVVADHNPFAEDGKKMKMTKLGHALYVALSALSPKFAQDAALGAVVGNVRRSGFDPAGLKKRLVTMDAEMDPKKMDEIIDAVIGVNDHPEAPEAGGDDPDLAAKAETSPVPLEPDKKEPEVAEDGRAEKIREMLDGKVDPSVIDAICAMLANPAEDEDPGMPGKIGGKPGEGGMVKKEEMKGAMDAMEKRLQAKYKAIEAAKEAVRPVVGAVMGMDSAEGIYGYALDHMKVEHQGINDVRALSALCKVAMMAAKTPTAVPLAQDANTVKSVPGLDRIRLA